MADFFQEFFLNPLLVNGWFNPVNTAVWGLILVASAYLVYTKLLRRLRVRVDRRFGLALLPFILWASTTRVLRDYFYSLAERSVSGTALAQRFATDIAFQAGLIQQQAFAYIGFFVPVPQMAGFFSWVAALFPTPGSYVFTFLFALGTLLLGLGIQKLTSKKPWKSRFPAIEYWEVMLLVGLAFSALNLWMIPWSNLYGMGLILGIAACFAAAFFGLTFLHERKILRIRQLGLFSRVNSCLLSAHMLDASATFVSVMFFGYYEQHPVPRLFIEAIGPWTFFLLKLAVLLPSLYIIDKYAEKGEFRNFLKIVILILGLAPGLRDMIRLGAGV